MTGVADRVNQVRERIEKACQRAGRDSAEITLVAISKTFPVEAILEAAAAGVTDFGENKAQEFTSKVDLLPDDAGIRWHFVGHLQRNKAKLVVGRAELFHALDSERLATAIQTAAERSDTHLDCLVQLNVSGEQSKFGIEPDEMEGLLDAVRAHDRIRPRGLMTLASPTEDPEQVRSEFRLLKECHDRMTDLLGRDADILSMGMSNDFEVAIEEGATHIRVGTAIFGPRPCSLPG